MQATSLEPIALLTTIALFWFLFHGRKPPARRSIAVLVLGDVGRSPRMMYHAQSLAENHFDTYLIGYSGEYSFILDETIFTLL
jgi:hypothetical protein